MASYVILQEEDSNYEIGSDGDNTMQLILVDCSHEIILDSFTI